MPTALALARRTGAGLFEPGLYKTKGELLLLQGTANAAEAEGCIRQAIQIALGQGNKLAELYATMSLARLLDKQENATRPVRCWPRSMAGSAKALTPRR